MQTTITWIPTDVELPDDSTVVLVALESGDEPTWIGYYDSAECDWFNSDGMRFKSAVSHWCELPVLVDLERFQSMGWDGMGLHPDTAQDRPIALDCYHADGSNEVPRQLG